MCSILYKPDFICSIANAAETVFRVLNSGEGKRGKIAAGNVGDFAAYPDSLCFFDEEWGNRYKVNGKLGSREEEEEKEEKEEKRGRRERRTSRGGKQMAEVMYGPMQLLVIVFDNPDFHGQIRRELESVMEKGIVRLIDLLFVWKDEEGSVKYMDATQLDKEERMRFGAVVGGLLGFGAGGVEGARVGIEEGAMAAAQENYGITEEDVLEVTDAIPEGTAAAVLIIEHLWAKNLKQAIRDAGGVLVSQGMLTPELLALVGQELAEAVNFADKEQKSHEAAAAV